MFKIYLFIIIWLCQIGSACALNVVNIKFNEQYSVLNQIVITFSNDIALKGQAPNLQQIDKINFPIEYKQHCRWRYVNLNKLSCDTYQRMPTFMPVEVSVLPGFKGVNTATHRLFKKQWVNTMLNVYQPNINKNSFEVILNTDNLADKTMAQSLLTAMQFKLNGKVITTKPITEEVKTNLYSSLKATFNFDSELEKGEFSVIVPKGFKASDIHSKLHENYTVFKTNNTPREPEYLGLFCIEYGESKWQHSFNKLESLPILSCPPEAITMGFSNELDKPLKYPLTIVSSKFNNAIKINGHPNHQGGVVYYSMALKGNKSYSLDITKLRSKAGKVFKHAKVERFTTQNSTAFWQSGASLGSMLNSQNKQPAILLARNTKDLKVKYGVFTSLKKLHAWLQLEKHQQESKRNNSHLLDINQVSNKVQSYNLPINAVLNSQAGIVSYSISGSSAGSLYDSKVVHKQEVINYISSDFNLEAFASNGLLVKTNAFTSNTAITATIWLTCQNSAEPILLGSTKHNGQLYLKRDKWQQFLNTKTRKCYVWAKSNGQHALLELNEAKSNSVTADVITSQPIYKPYDPIDFSLVLYRHTAKGLKPILDEVKVELIKGLKVESSIKLTQGVVSDKGFRQFSIPNGIDTAGFYIFKVKFNNEELMLWKHIIVSEYIAPEVEFTWHYPDEYIINKPFDIKVTGKTFNGFKARNFNGQVKYNISSVSSYYKPKGWPDDYKFADWDEFEDNDSTTQKLQVTDNEASCSLISNELLPLVELKISGQVTSEQGEVQFFNTKVPYLSRDHYIGVQVINDKLHVIAVDHHGQQVQVSADIAYEVKTKQDEKEHLIPLCKVKTPAYCSLPEQAETSAKLTITSGDKNYIWHRSIYFYKQEQPLINIDNKFKLNGLKSAKVNDAYDLTITSPKAGTANVFFNAGERQTIQTFNIKQGINKLPITINKAWLPQVNISAILSFTDDKRAVLKSHYEASIAEYLKSLTQQPKHIMWQSSDIKLPSKPNLHAFFDTLTIEVKPQQDLILTVNHNKQVDANGKVTISMKTNQNADLQVWLVNDALFNVAPSKAADVNFNKLFYGYHYEQQITHAFNGQDNFYAKLAELYTDHEHIAEYRNEVRYSRLASPPDRLTTSGHMPFSQKQSVWLTPISVKAKKTHLIEVNLPQLLGRWRVFAVALNETDTVSYTDTLTSHASLEYHLNAPAYIIKNDNAFGVITIRNHGSKALTDTVRVKLGQNQVLKRSFTIKGHSSEQINFKLPNTLLGKHTLLLTSANDKLRNKSVSYRILDNSYVGQQSWLINPSKHKQVVLDVKKQVNATTAFDAQYISPNWQGLAKYHEHYPYQCLEQTLSRAMSYHFNPYSQNSWKTGLTDLTNEVVKGVKANENYRGFSYYPYPYGATSAKLTAYTLLVQHWLTGSVFEFDISEQIIEEVKESINNGIEKRVFLKKTESHFNIADDWSLWALAEHQKIDIEHILNWRSTYGVKNVQSNLVQLLALKALGYEQSLLEGFVKHILDDGYEGEGLRSLSEPLEQCLAILLTVDKSLENKLAALATNVQLKQGHFGNTLSDAICSMALTARDKLKGVPVSLEKQNTIDNKTVHYQLTADTNKEYWLNIEYSQPLSSLNVLSNGVSITRTFSVLKENKWRQVDAKNLQVGDLVKVQLNVFSAVDRKQIVIKDYLAGGLNVLNPLHKNSQYRSWLNENKLWKNARIQSSQQNGKEVTWYQYWLNRGVTTFNYLAEVRFKGEYLAPSAKVELMYQPNVKGQSKSDIIEVK